MMNAAAAAASEAGDDRYHGPNPGRLRIADDWWLLNGSSGGWLLCKYARNI